MWRIFLVSGCIALFGGGWALGAQEHRNAAAWNAHSSIERLMYTNGYLEGYAQGSVDGLMVATVKLANEYKLNIASARSVDPSKLARMQAGVRDQTGGGRNQQANTVDVKKGIDAFYSDFRNQSVCWPNAFKFASMALNGDTPTEAELGAARKTDAENGCR